MFYYLVNHEYYEQPFMVFADNMVEAIEKVAKYVRDDGYNAADESIMSAERVDFDGIIIK